MRTFKLISAGRVVEFPGKDAGAALHVASRLGLDDADLFESGEYLLTLRRGGAIPSCWTIMSTREANGPRTRGH